MFLSASDRVMRGKKGTSGIHLMKTVQAIIVSVYHEPIVAEQVYSLRIQSSGDLILSYFSVR